VVFPPPSVTDPAQLHLPSEPETPEREHQDAAFPALTVPSSPTGPIWDLELVVSGDGGVEPAQAQTPGRRIHLTLGPYPDLSLASVRELADWHLEQTAQPVDGVTFQT
jgi:hypothetical protein